MQAKIMRINALLNQSDSIDFTKEMLEKIPQIIENEKLIFTAEKMKQNSEVSIVKEQLSQKIAQLKELEVKLENLSIEYNLAVESLKIQEEMSKKGAISREKYLQHLATKQKLYTQIEEKRYTKPIIQNEIEEWQKKLT